MPVLINRMELVIGIKVVVIIFMKVKEDNINNGTAKYIIMEIMKH